MDLRNTYNSTITDSGFGVNTAYGSQRLGVRCTTPSIWVALGEVGDFLLDGLRYYNLALGNASLVELYSWTTLGHDLRDFAVPEDRF